MKKTVQELIEMIRNKELHYDHSTQRKFIYADTIAQLNEGRITKSGSVIYSILEKNIRLPGIYFWHNTDTGDLNIHDGKQRILSLYYFITNENSMNIATIRHGKLTTFNGLSKEDQDKLLNYEFTIEENWGTSQEEEESFDAINSNSMNLTAYECLAGLLHGEWLKSFEDYITSKAKITDIIKPIGRGEQAYNFLLTMFNIADSKKSAYNDPARLNLRNAMRPLRHHQFNANDFDFEEILDVFVKLERIKFSNGTKLTSLSEESALAVAAYIVRHYKTRKDDIIDLYFRSSKQINDIAAWPIDFTKNNVQTHKTFIDKFVLEGKELDPKRFFNADVKDQLYRIDPRCVYVDPITGIRCNESNYNKLDVDHIKAWSESGRTELANAQLMCQHHNRSKGAN